ncbi:MAG: dihydroorotase [Prevotella sp.]|nr:dihydroorotase [Prevotella sp.]
MKTIICNGTIVNDGKSVTADLVIENGIIAEIIPCGTKPRGTHDKVVDATGCLVLPGVIDTHVHFREPGMTHKADMESESRAAAYGGVTTYFDMPNTNPPTTTAGRLEEKRDLARKKSHVNYSFFLGATNTNSNELENIDKKRIPGIKLFMGSSTGNLLVDGEKGLKDTFITAAEYGLPIMAHCEDNGIIKENMEAAMKKYGQDPPVCCHPDIRSAEACWKSASHAARLATENGVRLHIAHVSTEKELELSDLPGITLEATVAHILFSQDDYPSLGTKIKCNPAIKSVSDRDSLRKALRDGRITTIGTDHAPHTIEEKNGGARTAVSGMPMVQFSLPVMLSLADEGILTVERIVELMSHNPARLFSIKDRGFIRVGYKADIAIVSNNRMWTVTPSIIQSKCGWSPLEGMKMGWSVIHTFCNGHHILNDGVFDMNSIGEEILFDR